MNLEDNTGSVMYCPTSKPRVEVGKRSDDEMTYKEAEFYCFCLGEG